MRAAKREEMEERLSFHLEGTGKDYCLLKGVNICRIAL